MNNSLLEKDNILAQSKEKLSKAQYENNVILQNTSDIKEKAIQDLEDLVYNKLPTELKNFEVLYKKELELNTKFKNENLRKDNKEDFSKILKDMLRVYKQISMISISKTDKGYLKINFFNLTDDNREVYIILQVLGDYKFIELCPNINIKHLEEELTQTKNFTLFLTKLANELIRYFNR